MKQNPDKNRNQIRIIAGSLRGRKINFPDSLGLRPTPDRVRETLFNWLSPVIRGACCLDLFAGSAALSFEAISRGAEYVLAIEKAPQVVKAIEEQAAILKITGLDIRHIDSQIFLKSFKEHKPDQNNHFTPFDIVFVDPPYGSNLLLPSLGLLHENGWVKEKSLIYCGTDHPIQTEALPPSFKIIRQQKAGVVYYYLIKIQPS